jgi:hypothetical protein
MMCALNGQTARAIIPTADRPLSEGQAATYLKGKGSLLEEVIPHAGTDLRRLGSARFRTHEK